MTKVSVWDSGVIALTAALRALPECRDPGVPTSTRGLVPVYLGPQWLTSEDPADALVIGYGEEDEPAGQFDSEPGAMSPERRRDEKGTIRCLSSTLAGDDDPARSLTAAFALIDLVDAVVRIQATAGDGDLGLKASVPVQHALFQFGGAGAVRWSLAKAGTRCNVEFTVTYTAKV